MSSASAIDWTVPVTPDREEKIDGARTATSAAAHLFPEINIDNDASDDVSDDASDEVSDSAMAKSVFAGGSRSVFDESNGGGFVPTAEDRRKQALRAREADLAKREAALRSDASSRASKNSIEIFSEDELEPYLGEIATILKTFVEKNKCGNKIFSHVLMGISSLKGRLLFKPSTSFEAKSALTNAGVITNPVSDNSGNEFYMYNTSFVIPPIISGRIAPVSEASISQLPAVARPSSTQTHASSGGAWAMLSSTEKLSPSDNLLHALDINFNTLDFKTLKRVLFVLKETTVAVEGIYTKKRAEMIALLEDA